MSIADGSLRSDLFYRLGVVFIHIVPLRERMTDLPLLVDHFIDKHNKTLGRQVRGVEERSWRCFTSITGPAMSGSWSTSLKAP